MSQSLVSCCYAYYKLQLSLTFGVCGWNVEQHNVCSEHYLIGYDAISNRLMHFQMIFILCNIPARYLTISLASTIAKPVQY